MSVVYIFSPLVLIIRVTWSLNMETEFQTVLRSKHRLLLEKLESSCHSVPTGLVNPSDHMEVSVLFLDASVIWWIKG